MTELDFCICGIPIDDLAVHDQCLDVLGHPDVLERIALDHEQVGDLPRSMLP